MSTRKKLGPEEDPAVAAVTAYLESVAEGVIWRTDIDAPALEVARKVVEAVRRADAQDDPMKGEQ